MSQGIRDVQTVNSYRIDEYRRCSRYDAACGRYGEAGKRFPSPRQFGAD